MEKYLVGYTTGVYDLFHAGHLNIIRNAKALCDKLIVGVSTDELVAIKGKKCVVPFEERIEIVRNLKFVDVAVPQDTVDKFEDWRHLKFDVLFVGSDWFGTPTWKEYEKKLKSVGVKVLYFPYTKGVSSTMRRATLKE